MGTVTFKVRRRRRYLAWSALNFALLGGAVADLAAGTDLLRGDLRTMLIALGAIAGPLLLDVAGGTTVLTPTALTTRSLFGRRSCAWKEIRHVEIKERRGRGYSAWIYVLLADGRSIKLKAPFSTNRSANSELDEAVSAIRRYCMHTPRRSTGRH